MSTPPSRLPRRAGGARQPGGAFTSIRAADHLAQVERDADPAGLMPRILTDRPWTACPASPPSNASPAGGPGRHSRPPTAARRTAPWRS
ncbi:hypothetical protein [Streptomyces tropicalis]|uniref:Uncharacterized protein n=1 Tax=Streptomyces tropicalis TaxID=3034234 RepID=A0ABT6A2I0_9ACTN|nr:hypothetical protein [Streptomyces tropicalis]MDF3298842.1 hypothetical protein [Streptomyces tropicalis]